MTKSHLLTRNRQLTAAKVRAAVHKLVADGELPDPRRASDGALVLELDDHVDDEAMSPSRLRLVLRNTRDIRALARALEDDE